VSTGSGDHTARLWEVASGQERTRLTHDDTVWAVAFSPDGRQLASASENGIVHVWEVASGELVRELASPEDQFCNVHTVAFSPDGRQLASSGGGPVRVWDAASGKPVRELLNSLEQAGCGGLPSVPMCACWPSAAGIGQYGSGRWPPGRSAPDSPTTAW
jgi:WD40 repeat protein